MNTVTKQEVSSVETTAQTHWILPASLRSKLDNHPIEKNLYITEIAFYPEQSALEKEVLKNKSC